MKVEAQRPICARRVAYFVASTFAVALFCTRSVPFVAVAILVVVGAIAVQDDGLWR